MTVVGQYVDTVSGKLASRPQLDRLMVDCRAGLIDVVIVSKLDRFGRSLLNAVTLITELEGLGVALVSIAERIDNSPAGRLQRNLFLSIAEWERERILERTTGGAEAAARKGWYPAGGAPFGWRLVKGENGRTFLALDDAEVAVWEKIATDQGRARSLGGSLPTAATGPTSNGLAASFTSQQGDAGRSRLCCRPAVVDRGIHPGAV